MKPHILSVFVSLLLLMGSATFAQDLKLSYTVDQVSAEMYNVEIAVQATEADPIALKAVNFSLAFDLACAHPTGYQTMLTDTWTTFLENAKVNPGLELAYRSEPSSARWQFGSADPGLPATSIVDLPLSDESPLPIMIISFEGSCAHDIYLENQSENSLNQFADENMSLLNYEVLHPARTAQAPFAFKMVEANPIDDTRTQVIWVTENEKGEGMFEIEKSENQDFSNFVLISNKKATTSTDQINNYQYIEEGEMTSRSFYRLKYIDMDGNVDYSQAVKVEREKGVVQLSLQTSVFPNPTSDYLTVLMEGKSQQKLQLSLTDLNGKVLLKKAQSLDNTGFAELKLDLRSYSQAIYMLEVSDEQQKSYPQSIRIVKK